MAWRRPGDKPLSEPILVRSLTHICVTRPQWVKTTHIHTSVLPVICNCLSQSQASTNKRWLSASNSIAKALSLLQYCNTPSIYTPRRQQHQHHSLYFISPRARINITRGTWLCKPFLGLLSLRRHHFIGIGIPIINLRWSSSVRSFIMGIPMPV